MTRSFRIALLAAAVLGGLSYNTTQNRLAGELGDCGGGTTSTSTDYARCGGWAQTGMPCVFTGTCNSPAPAWMTTQPGCATGFRYMWDEAPVMSTCQNTGSYWHSCDHCTVVGGTNTGMECAHGKLYSSVGGSCNPHPKTGNVVCSVTKFCGGTCCEL